MATFRIGHSGDCLPGSCADRRRLRTHQAAERPEHCIPPIRALDRAPGHDARWCGGGHPPVRDRPRHRVGTATTSGAKATTPASVTGEYRLPRSKTRWCPDPAMSRRLHPAPAARPDPERHHRRSDDQHRFDPHPRMKSRSRWAASSGSSGPAAELHHGGDIGRCRDSPTGGRASGYGSTGFRCGAASLHNGETQPRWSIVSDRPNTSWAGRVLKPTMAGTDPHPEIRVPSLI
jgi:hypothetical protein